MKHFLFLLVFVFAIQVLNAQYVYTIKADSVKITNSCDAAELIIENHTQTVPGFLFNKGRGRTEFRKVFQNLTDNTFLIGSDTMKLSNVWMQGGNRFGATGLLGTNDNYPLTFIQNGVEKGRIDTGGNWLFNTVENNSYPFQFKGNIWHSGILYQEKNVFIAPFEPGEEDARIIIGGNNVVGSRSIGIGDGVQVDGTGLTALGIGLGNTVVRGIGIFGSTTEGIAIGHNSYAHKGAVVLGSASTSTAWDQFVCGGPDRDWDANSDGMYKHISEVYFGSGVQRSNTSGPGVSYSINGSGAYGANYRGGDITITGGKGTGTGTPGSIIFSTPQVSSSGTTLQTLSERARIDSNGNFGIGTSTPSTTLDVHGTGHFDNVVTSSGHRSAVRNITANTTISDTDEYVFVNAASTATVNVTLPPTTGRDGQTYTIKRIDDNISNAVTITSASSQSVDGINPYPLAGKKYITIVANSGTWIVVSQN
ncbi:hypothetical protein A4H97_30650 [Niastella yeongjuensis]|uniref:Uncharacterized protein n=1 Tax=Niastella yeongjuensis TaxID=354355 RepID=A0A1V9EPB3_9BACT|nr:hypothetical protein [Niastella yeongjuensis]OQP47872.1 hypothetical protein A4H97_30650 [Niastella yeongjuensis]SEP48227.1 hypothetical protein SAMN05660816_06715 [Niastella yeongjuensis]